jgi:hypothetical protein
MVIVNPNITLFLMHVQQQNHLVRDAGPVKITFPMTILTIIRQTGSVVITSQQHIYIYIIYPLSVTLIDGS